MDIETTKLSYQVLHEVSLELLLVVYSVNHLERQLKQWTEIKATKYKAKKLRVKSTYLYKKLLMEHFPIKDYPEKYI